MSNNRERNGFGTGVLGNGPANNGAMHASEYLFHGQIVHCDRLYDVTTIDGFVYVKDKLIEYYGPDRPRTAPHTKIIHLNRHQFLMPGMIDCHIHAPQYPETGLGYDKKLMDWLHTYIYRCEMMFENVEDAERIYRALVRKLLSHGTTTASYFATTYLDSTVKLVDLLIEHGQRALVGLVNMCEYAPPELLHRDAETSLALTERFIKIVQGKKNALVRPAITPRSARTCNESLLLKLSELAERYDLNIQSHISENVDEIAAALKLYPKCKTYADVFEAHGMLGPRTLLAHAIHLSDAEVAQFKQAKTSVAHCPSSNTCLQSGLCNLRRFIEAGVIVGLATDISGGRSVSIIEAMRDAIDTSIHLSYSRRDLRPVTYKEAFYLATLGGAKALRLDGKVGNFARGKEFDGLVIDMSVSGNVDLIDGDYTIEELLQKFVCTADDRNIKEVYVAGRRVK